MPAIRAGIKRTRVLGIKMYRNVKSKQTRKKERRLRKGSSTTVKLSITLPFALAVTMADIYPVRPVATKTRTGAKKSIAK